jgi:hypothetical protein
MPQSPSPSSLEQVRQALRRAFDLGQLYWQQADSDSPRQHAKADQTQAKFDALVAQTCSALQQQEAGSARQIIEEIANGWDGCEYDAPGGGIDIGYAIRAHADKLLACAPSPTEPKAAEGRKP